MKLLDNPNLGPREHSLPSIVSISIPLPVPLPLPLLFSSPLLNPLTTQLYKQPHCHSPKSLHTQLVLSHSLFPASKIPTLIPDPRSNESHSHIRETPHLQSPPSTLSQNHTPYPITSAQAHIYTSLAHQK